MLLSIIKKQFIGPFLIIVTIFLFSKVLSSFYNSTYYPFLLHPLFQFFIVIVSIIIFILGIHSYRFDNSGIQYSIGLLFFVIGTFEFFHMVTHIGMLSFISNSFLPSTYWFEILSDLTGCIGFFLIFIFRNFINTKYHNLNKYKLLSVLTLITFTSVVFLLLFSAYLPLLVPENSPSTLRFKLIYIAIIFNTFDIFICTYFFFTSKNEYYSQYSNGFIILLFSNFFLLIAKNPCGIELLVSHVLKIIGFFFLLRGIFQTNFSTIYHNIEIVKLSKTRNLIKRKVKNARQKERKRMSQDLHDSLGQMLFVIVIKLRVLKNLSTNETVIEEITELEKMVRTLMIEVKDLAFTLRPSLVEELGLRKALKSLINQFSNLFNIEIKFHCEILNDFPNQKIETAIFRICQESLTNAVKYAYANQIIVRLSEFDNSTNLTISDNGIGFNYDPIKLEGKSLGLSGMRERAKSVGGTFSVISELGTGTTIQVNIPKNRF